MILIVMNELKTTWKISANILRATKLQDIRIIVKRISIRPIAKLTTSANLWIGKAGYH